MCFLANLALGIRPKFSNDLLYLFGLASIINRWSATLRAINPHGILPRVSPGGEQIAGNNLESYSTRGVPSDCAQISRKSAPRSHYSLRTSPSSPRFRHAAAVSPFLPVIFPRRRNCTPAKISRSRQLTYAIKSSVLRARKFLFAPSVTIARIFSGTPPRNK